MVLLASAGLSSLMSSWPRMQSGQKNPFQNAPGPFIYALPNLAGTCPFSFSSDTDLFCSFSGDSNAPAPAPAPDPHHQDHHRCCHSHSPAVVTPRCSCCPRHDPPPSESAEPLAPITSTKEGAADTESPLPAAAARPSAPSLSPSDEVHFGLGNDVNSSLLTEGGSELQQQQQQQKEPQASETSTPPSTPAQSNALSSPTGSDFQEGPKEEGGEGEGDEVKVKKGGRRKRRRGKGASDRRRKLEHGVGSIAPRFIGLSGVHYGLWTQYVCPSPQAQAPPLFPPLPPATNHHHAWSFAGPGYHHDGFVVPPSSPAHHLWTPMVPATGFVGVPVA